MAGTSLLTLIDDIATLLDDVATMSKLAVKKTAGVLGDDLALNAEQVTGVRANRELPVVWAVAVGSLKNKAILVPAALLISAFIPWAIQPLLMIGGLFLCYEGVHKVLHSLHPKDPEEKRIKEQELRALAGADIDLVQLEKKRISGAIRTDFILSAEIIVITLGALAESTFTVQVATLVTVALLITVGVYGIVAAIVKMDDLGIYLYGQQDEGVWDAMQRKLGAAVLWMAPKLMRFLSIAGTIAMFLVGGGIIAHAIGPLYDALHHVEVWFEEAAPWSVTPVMIIAEGLVGVAAGLIAAGIWWAFNRLRGGGASPETAH